MTWKPSKYECPDCKTIIWSRYSGQYCSCKCGECFIDETDCYIRIGGKPVLVEQGENNNE